MSNPNPKIGSVGWFDLTVENAESIRDFYSAVVGWKSSPVEMGGYSDFCMNQPEDGTTVAGICHARGGNSNLPANWLMYITVADLETSRRRCLEAGGKILVEPKNYGMQGKYCIIQDPAGAVAALYKPQGEPE